MAQAPLAIAWSIVPGFLRTKRGDVGVSHEVRSHHLGRILTMMMRCDYECIYASFWTLSALIFALFFIFWKSLSEKV